MFVKCHCLLCCWCVCLCLQVTVCGLAKVAISTTNVHTKRTIQIYEKLSYEAQNRHFCQTAVRRMCFEVGQSFGFMMPVLYKSNAFCKMFSIVFIGKSLFGLTLKIFIRERSPSSNSEWSRYFPSTIRM